MYKRIALIILLIIAISFIYYQAEVSASKKSDKKLWLTDFDQAKKDAEKNDKPIFILFTGSDWCHWCKKLNSEILTKSIFIKYAKENLILLKIDFPRKSMLSPDVVKKNRSLAKTYGVRGYPTIMITDLEGTQKGKMGYMKGGPKIFIKKLDKIISGKKKRRRK